MSAEAVTPVTIRVTHPFQPRPKKLLGLGWVIASFIIAGLSIPLHIYLMSVFLSFNFVDEAMTLTDWVIPLTIFLITFTVPFFTLPWLTYHSVRAFIKKRKKFMIPLGAASLATIISCALAIFVLVTMLAKLQSINLGFYFNEFGVPYLQPYWDDYVVPILEGFGWD